MRRSWVLGDLPDLRRILGYDVMWLVLDTCQDGSPRADLRIPLVFLSEQDGEELLSFMRDNRTLVVLIQDGGESSKATIKSKRN